MLFYFQTVCLKAEKRIKVAGKVNCQKRRAPSLSKSCKYSFLLHQTDPVQNSTGCMRFPGFCKHLSFQRTHDDVCACVYMWALKNYQLLTKLKIIGGNAKG